MNTEIGQPQSASKWTVPVRSLSLSASVSLSAERDRSPTQNQYVRNICCADKSRTVLGFFSKNKFSMFISLSLYRYFSLSSSICVSVSLLLSILLCGFSVIFLCYFVCLSSGFCFCASHGAFQEFSICQCAGAELCPKLCIVCAQHSFRFSFGLCLRKVQ